MKKSIVIDSTIFCNSFLDNGNASQELKSICSTVLFFLASDENDYRIVLDCRKDNDAPEGLIMKEYRDNLSGNRDFEVFYINLHERNKIRWVNIIENEKISIGLIKNNFHEIEDHVFVFTALASDKIIVTEDSDYGIDSKEEYHKCSFNYLTKKLNLQLFTAQLFWQKVDSSHSACDGK